jgi:predicted amidohydrolase
MENCHTVTHDTPTHPTVGACQFEPAIGDEDANIATIRHLASANRDAAVLVFPELAVTGYDVDTAIKAATPVPGPITERLRDIAAETETTLVVGLPERDDDVYNDLVAVSGDGVEAVYRKQYAWGDEAGAFRTGDSPVTVETPAGTLGFLLCYDLNFPEAALAYADADVDVLAVSAAWRESYRTDWRVLLRARALDSPCYTVGVNHAGNQQGRTHRGGSLIADPTGNVVAEGADDQTTVAAPLEPDVLASARERNPVRRTRRER